MGLLDELAEKLKQGLELIAKMGEDAAQTAKLRYEIFNLGRELETQFNKLGKVAYENQDPLESSGIRMDIDRIKAEIARLEQTLKDMGESEAPAEATAEAEPEPKDAETEQKVDLDKENQN